MPPIASPSILPPSTYLFSEAFHAAHCFAFHFAAFNVFAFAHCHVFAHVFAGFALGALGFALHKFSRNWRPGTNTLEKACCAHQDEERRCNKATIAEKIVVFSLCICHPAWFCI